MRFRRSLQTAFRCRLEDDFSVLLSFFYHFFNRVCELHACGPFYRANCYGHLHDPDEVPAIKRELLVCCSQVLRTY